MITGEQLSIPCTLMRGGTSKGLYFRAHDLPFAGPERDALLKCLVGSEDLLQIDGLGGSRLVTAKLAIVDRSARPDADVDYTYAIVPPGRGLIAYTSNCGNISAGVGPFAIDNGLVEAREPITEVRIFNTNTKKLLIAHVPVEKGRARVRGDFAIPGVPGTGAEIFMDYRATTGAKTGKIFPTGRRIDSIAFADGRRIEATLGDVANPCVFVRAADLGASGSEHPDEINSNADLLSSLRELRGKAAQAMSLASDWRTAETQSPALPLVVMVAEPQRYADSQGRVVTTESMDLRARLVFYNRCHESMAGTGAVCTAAMSRIPGTIVHQAVEATPSATRTLLRIGHPLGVMEVVAKAYAGGEPHEPAFERLGFSRTARILMRGLAFAPAGILPEFADQRDLAPRVA